MKALKSTSSPAIRSVFLIGAAVAVTAASPRTARGDVVRVSVKVVLDEDGDTPSGDYGTLSGIKQAIAEADAAAHWSGLCWRIQMVDAVSVPGISEFFVIDSEQEMLDLENQAIADPGRFGWRFDAINFYIVDDIDTSGSPGGVCSFPSRTSGRAFEVIVIESGILNGGVGWLHEIGHYLSLMHTFDCSDGSCSEDQDICRGWGAFFSIGSETFRESCPDVCPHFVNVMSYNSMAPQDAKFSECQKEHMNFQLLQPDAGGKRSSVLQRQALRVAKFGQPYLSIRDGIIAACPGGTIEIFPETYAETTPFPRKWVILKAVRGTVVVTPP